MQQPSQLESITRLGCGATIGLLCGASLGLYFFGETSPTTVVVVCLLLTIGCAVGALRGGDRFWVAFTRWLPWV